MKHYIAIAAILAALFAGCAPTRIVTYSPRPASTYYTTTITPARTNVTTTVAQVYSTNEDISLHLDLQAVAALWSQASSVREFEQMLNSSTYPISNMDLNGDGYIDYLRVLETVQGYNHVFLIQAVLADNVFQDVATLVAEVPSRTEFHVEIIGSPFIYGPNYIIRPTFIIAPHIFDVFFRVSYTPWRSPWYWNHFPPHYRHPRPIYLNHYQAYVHTYITTHRYCREMMYPPEPHYRDYAVITRDYQRNDYGSAHPDKAFTIRNANTPMVGSQVGSQVSSQASQGRVVRNAYDIRMNSEASKVTTTTTPTVQRSAASATRVAGSTSASQQVKAQGRTASTQERAVSAATAGNSNRAATTTRGSADSGTSTASRSVTNSSAATATRGAGSTAGRDVTRSSSESNSNTVVRSRVNASGSSSTSVTRSSGSSSAASGRSSASQTRPTAPSSATRSSSSVSSPTRSSSSSATRGSSSASSATRGSSSAASATRGSSSAASATRGSSGSSSSSSSVTRGTRR